MIRFAPIFLLAACHPAREPVDSGDGPEVLLSLSQAVAGAMWANPAAYAEIPVHVNVAGEPASVDVSLDGVLTAAEPGLPGDWVARVPIAGLAAGEHALVASAEGAEPVEATLVLGEEGVQITAFATDGAAETPRVHHSAETLWLTWTDRSAGLSEAWLRTLDGAGRWTGERVALVHAAEETLYARTAVGHTGTVGVLYQSAGGMPYFNHFLIADLEGNTLFGPLDLDPTASGGSPSGDIDVDERGFVMVWRSANEAGGHTLWWQHVDERSFAVTGPVALASTGPGTTAEPDAGFDPFGHLDLAAVEDEVLVGWVQYRYNSLLGMEIPLARLALLRSGSVLWSELAGEDVYYAWDRECRVFATGYELDQPGPAFTVVWSDVDLRTDEMANDLHALSIDYDAQPGDWTLLLDAVDDNDEPFLQGTPGLPGTLAWWDHRAYTEDPANGRISLYAATVGDDLAFTGEETIFEHARTVAGVSWLSAEPLGTNAMLAWSDERHGSGILDPKPEVYLETAWR
ncbi:MAG: hypothetical protein ABIO70_26635 [Pseudomonadota bacterium]